MSRFRLSPEATQDLTEIYEYIAQDNIGAAERVRAEIYDALSGLAAMPGKGHRRADLTAQPVLL
ncbi:MAG: type II toxin-antitoxin system RelE/ParE family toxin [Terriglobia bacterium]